MNMSLHRQKGGSLVEMAIVLILFLMIMLAVMEFSITIFRSAQLAEATRYGLRHAIVNDPLGTLPSCPGGDSETTPCDSTSCPDLIDGMANFAPMIIDQEGDELVVTVEYTCPGSGYLDQDGLYLVTVTVTGAKRYLAVSGILGLGVAIDLQDFKSTRLSEDLHTGG
ncbi:MAG: pilus assembly protein [Gammaproteobacteria bacterium]|nr:pilus assembly protein [Gammaproteobacteria bacterium]